MAFSRWLALVAGVSLLIGSGRADADYINFAFLGTGLSGSGAVNVTANGDGTYTATSGQLTVYGGAQSGTSTLYANPNGTKASQFPDAAGKFSSYAYDDQILLNQSVKVTYNGLLFRIGNYDYNLFYNTGISNPDIELLECDGTSTSSFIYTQVTYKGLQLLVGGVQSGAAPIVPNVVPEPSALALCGIAGVIGLGANRVRRRIVA